MLELEEVHFTFLFVASLGSTFQLDPPDFPITSVISRLASVIFFTATFTVTRRYLSFPVPSVALQWIHVDPAPTPVMVPLALTFAMFVSSDSH